MTEYPDFFGDTPIYSANQNCKCNNNCKCKKEKGCSCNSKCECKQGCDCEKCTCSVCSKKKS